MTEIVVGIYGVHQLIQQGLILTCMDACNRKQVKILGKAEAVLSMNQDCKMKLTNVIKNDTTIYNNSDRKDILAINDD